MTKYSVQRTSPLDGMTIKEYDAYQDELLAIDKLSPQQVAMRERAKMLRGVGRTYQQIGNELGVSRQRIHQLLKGV